MAPTRNDRRPRQLAREGTGETRRRALLSRPVSAVTSLDELFEQCLPAFGGAYLRRLWTLLDEAIGHGLPMTLSVAGPVTVSGQHQSWLGPLLETGWFCLLSTTDAVCYHDGHRALDDAAQHPIHEVPIFGDDSKLRDESIIRVTDCAFDESVLLDQDAFLSACLRQPEFRRKMSGTEFRHLLGLRYAAQERHNGVQEGLLALCARKAIPVFVGAPADGSIFLNALKLWALRQAAGTDSGEYFEFDLEREVFESCAFHYWAQRLREPQPENESERAKGAIGTLILGGGVPKNFNLQPEPALSQILGFEDVTGYLYDIQITTAPVSDGSLSSCPPSEAVTWGKVDSEHHRSTCESMQCDYSVVMPLLVKALLEKRARLEQLARSEGRGELVRRHPEARGYLREDRGYRLYERRSELVEHLTRAVAERAPQLRASSEYPLAPSIPSELG